MRDNSDDLPTDLLGPREIVIRGRTHQAIGAAVALTVYVTVCTGAYLYIALVGQSRRDVAGGIAATLVVVCYLLALMVVLLLRRLELKRATIRPPVPVEKVAYSRVPSGTAVVCSGGGIKSAAFSLGAMQRLQAAGKLTHDTRLVAVSGGGYMAGAWAASGVVAPQGGGLDASAVAALRSRTDYLYRAGRARLELIVTMLLGLVVNVAILGGPLITFAWLLGGFALGTGLLRPAESASGPRGIAASPLVLGPLGALMIPGFVLIILAIAMFCIQRLSGNNQRWGGKRLVCWLAGANDSSADALATGSSTPIRVLATAFAYLVAVPGLLAFTKGVNYFPNLSPGPLFAWLSANPQAVSSTAGGLTALVALAHSGTRARTPRSNLGSAWLLIRRLLAPALVLLLILVLVAFACGTVVAYEVRTPIHGSMAWIVASLAVVTPAAAWLMASANLSSIHPFYRDRLRFAYVDSVIGSDSGLTESADLDLGTVTASSRKGPELALVCTANAEDADHLPSGRGGAPFLLGAEVGFYRPVGQYAACTVPAGQYRIDGNVLTLAEAMSISGAAISPRDGRESRALGPWRVVLALANIRLGVWAPSPYYARPVEPGGRLSSFTNVATSTDHARAGTSARADTGGAAADSRSVGGEDSDSWRSRMLTAATDLLDRPRALKIVVEALGSMRLDQPYLYLTDGGHFDNLGMVAALMNPPAVMYVIDGTGDDEDSFAAVGDAIATARMDLGVEVAFDPDGMLRGNRAFPERGWAEATATHPAWPEPCRIIYIKAVLPAGLSWDLYAYKDRNPAFPQALQRFESFDEFDFEEYRQLGWCLTSDAIRGSNGTGTFLARACRGIWRPLERPSV